ncbi:A disintegrin and metalloproteinase with thrombospondin motifs 7 isoform X2 [Pseudophryne corroboree]|uniref:A disintegrin and metalloproteinase with thrombospondin motifs 7 isoform X2 n=1 Tax=Pseudophryne corroboree TaxID=495146 RepID=UPI0030819C2A
MTKRPICILRMWLLLALFSCGLQDVAPLLSDLPLSFSLDSDIVHPVRVDEHGSFLTFDLIPRNLQKRGVSSSTSPSLYYEIRYQGVELTFNLSQNHELLAPGYVSEWRSGGLREAEIISRPSSSCHMQGEVQTHHQRVGNAAISICGGLRGVFQMEQMDYLIEPVTSSALILGEAMPHRIYKRHLADDQESGYRSCGVREHPDSQDKWERRRERWEETQKRHRRERLISRRSISKEKWVEALVVADSKMVEYHGKNNVENYVLTVMNMVAGLFRDASIGNRINIVIVRLILLESEEEELKISHHADNSLRSFCKWQKGLNMKSEDHPLHHDIAVLLTRRDLCASMNRPCETLGLSHVAGMCQPHRSCNINEDTGLPTAFTVTHELGHSFGVQHDGNGNDCQPRGKKPHIMSPQLTYGTSPLTWSRCSRDYITRFLDRGWGLCLDDLPSNESLSFPSVLPGILYDVGHQCRLQYGSASTFCHDIDNVCNSLWCTVGSTCHSKLDAAVDGTTCGENKWCFGGDCVPVGHRAAAVDGAWGSWSAWSQCTRSCEAGVQSAERYCSNPTPRYGGRYCLGERKRYRVCNVLPCPSGVPSFRQMQCSQFDSIPVKGKLHHWSPVLMSINPCELHCKSGTEYFAEKLLDAVIDGTPCYEGNSSRDMCINGICKNIGCDYEIDSNAEEDRCGVCLGNSSSCHTVHKTFEDSDGLGYVDIGLIPPGAREIRIEEVAEAGNFLALRSEDPEKYFLNGRWTIQWNGEYEAAGTTFTYTRTGNLENLTAPGPTYEPVWIQLLFQEKNPGVRYQYTIKRDLDSSNEIQPPDFSWRYGAWSECSTTCGTGVQRQLVHCVERVAGLVEERYCDYLTRPDDRQRNCNEEPCPPRWWVGEWQQCSITCGAGGVQKRTVLCIQRVGLDEQRALQHSDCQHLPKPESSINCNQREPCPAVWHHGNWSQCSVSCGEGVQYRDIFCDNELEGGACKPSESPITKKACVMPSCPPGLSPFDWTGSGASSKEVVNEIFPGHPRASSSKQDSMEDNSIFEGDFSNVGNGGQGKVGRAFVDDFYYDYNFINFHEDLTYDPLEDNDIKGGGELDNEYLPTHVPHVKKVSKDQNIGSMQFTESPNKYLTTNALNDLVSSDHRKTSAIPSTSMEVQNDVTESPKGTIPVIQKSFSWDQLTTTPSDEEGHNDKNHLVTTTDKPDETSVLSVTTHIIDISLPDNSVRSTLHLPVTQQPSAIPKAVTLFPSTHSSSRYLISEVTPGPVSSTFSPDSTYKSSEIPIHDPSPDMRQEPLPEPQWNLLTDHTPKDVLLDHTQLPPHQEKNTTLDSHQLAKDSSAILTWNSATTPLDPIHTIKLTLQAGHGNTTSVGPQVTPTFPTMTIPLPTDILTSVILHSPKSYIRGDADPHLNKKGTTTDSSTTHSSHSLSSLGEEDVQKSHWEVGNWSECSTTCGLGAMWRSVLCRAGENGICDANTKPAPARRCYLRPCASWTVGNWSKCSRSCGTGVRLREVQCVDVRDKRLLRPFHCKSTDYKPRVQTVCHERKCMEWYISSWRECSEECGGGMQQRLVTCPQTGRCDEGLKPNNSRSCNDHPCTTWAVGPWGQVSHALVTASPSASAGL